ncbi:hypothetical protein J2Y55_002139 [Bosea sp. BE125]|uniref:hypothetical protein n=1 Tax=Bosea sp. BE125 TaxID=2817909 RepID=UPI00285EAEDB|nr:hypothetical protein [Bosea sp. BE125]MDR6871131.1 hypothetical protein [Bosea sp. BE125]
MQNDQSPSPGLSPGQSTALSFDVEAYLPYVQEFDVSDAQSRELLGALWSIMVAFVDLGLPLAPVQEAREVVYDRSKSLSADSATALASIQSIASQFTTSAAPLVGRVQERKET